MKISEGWLREHLETALSFAEISEVLTQMGLEVESTTLSRHDLDLFESAQILSAEPHPDAQKLQVCRVRAGQAGQEQELTIVCGAPNARAGLRVVLAPVGAVIPTSGLVIQPTRIRGIVSEGMLCSAKELGVGAESDGIIELSQDVALGAKYGVLCGLDEGVWDINITPNRGDCLSVRGIARDLAATGFGSLRSLSDVRGEVAQHALNTAPSPLPDICPFFLRRTIKNIRPCESPQWLKRRLQQVGLKSISVVVDLLQWIMWDLGHPMHAYDADTLAGDLSVRWAYEGEIFQGLNDKPYMLKDQDLVVWDSEKTVALAGILGSQATACTSTTQSICLEAALFQQETIARTGQRLMIATDARTRFERGVDPQAIMYALDTATRWIVALCGGEVSDVVASGSGEMCSATPISLIFDSRQFERYTGVPLQEPTKSIALLRGLGCEVRLLDRVLDSWSIEVIPPSWRHDLKINEDLVEEVLRLMGYDAIPEVIPSPRIGCPPRDERALALNRIRQTLTYRGYHEVVNWSFVHDRTLTMFGVQPQVIVDNPISQELNVLRPSLLPQLLDRWVEHRAHGVKHSGLFEIGPVFQGTKPEDQWLCVAGVRSGLVNEPHWHHQTSAGYDVFDMKVDVWNMVEAWGFQPDRLQITTQNLPLYYHPGRAGMIQQGPKTILGAWGELHPAQHALWDMDVPMMMFEMWVDRWAVVMSKTFRPAWAPSLYPAVWRDFAFIIGASVRAADVIRGIQSVEPAIIRGVRLFDLYDDPAWSGQQRSYAFRVHMRSETHTLTEDQIRTVSDKIIDKVVQTWKATLRNG